MKQLSLIKPVVTPKVEISDELFRPLFTHPLLPYNVLSIKGKHFGSWKPKATSVLLQQRPSSTLGLSAPSQSAAAVTNKGISEGLR